MGMNEHCEQARVWLGRAVECEKERAKGLPAFSGGHEAYAGVLEEVEAAASALKALGKALAEYWEAVKLRDEQLQAMKLPIVRELALSLALEAAGAAALAGKALDGFEAGRESGANGAQVAMALCELPVWEENDGDRV